MGKTQAGQRIFFPRTSWFARSIPGRTALATVHRLKEYFGVCLQIVGFSQFVLSGFLATRTIKNTDIQFYILYFSEDYDDWLEKQGPDAAGGGANQMVEEEGCEDGEEEYENVQYDKDGNIIVSEHF